MLPEHLMAHDALLTQVTGSEQQRHEAFEEQGGARGGERITGVTGQGGSASGGQCRALLEVVRQSERVEVQKSVTV